MPVIKSAIKKLRKDRKRERVNEEFEAQVKHAIKNARKTKTEKSVREAQALVDKATKKHIYHTNKGNRIKASLAKLIAKPTKKTTPTAKKATKKSK